MEGRESGGLKFRLQAVWETWPESDRVNAELRTPEVRWKGASREVWSSAFRRSVHQLALLRSQFRIVPSFAVVPNRKALPDAGCFVPSDLREVFPCAAPWPLEPPVHVAVPNRIVVDVVERCPNVPIGSHRTLRCAKEHLSTAHLILAIP